MGRERFFSRKESFVEEPTVNLTPLIDVVFVILIMFIVIAPLLEVDKVQLASAPSAKISTMESVQESSKIAVYVHEDNAIYFEGALLTPRELTLALIKAKAQFPKSHPQIFHDKQAKFGTYQDVKNAAEAAGFSQIDIILKPS